MDYEYSVIGSIFCNAKAFATAADSSEFIYNHFIFKLRKFNDQISVSLCNFDNEDSKADNNSTDFINNICKKITEDDVISICKLLSEKYSCRVTLRKGYEFYGNANVFNGGSDYEIIEEKWFVVQFNNGIQEKT